MMKFEFLVNKGGCVGIGDFQVDFRIPFTFDVHSISGYKIQVNVTDESEGNVFKENYIWGQGGSHIWLSQKNDGKRIMIFR